MPCAPTNPRPPPMRSARRRSARRPREIVFVSSNGWDVAGATWFGYTTFWLNRAGLPAEELGVTPHGAGRRHDRFARLYRRRLPATGIPRPVETPEPHAPQPWRLTFLNPLRHQANRLTDQGENMANSLTSLHLPQGMAITADIKPGYEAILTREALELVADAAPAVRAAPPATARGTRRTHEAARCRRASRFPAGNESRSAKATGRSRRCRSALQCRRVEITGPVERKMIINALNSGADAYMTDFEDSNTPNWDNQIDRPHQSEGSRARHDLAGTERQVVQAQRHDRDADRASARLASRREARDGRRPARLRRHLRFRAVPVPQREGTACARRRARSSICRSWRAISKRACGTRSSSRRRKRSACRAARFARPCSSKRFSPRSKWTRSCMNCANTARA